MQGFLLAAFIYSVALANAAPVAELPAPASGPITDSAKLLDDEQLRTLSNILKEQGPRPNIGAYH